jgi:hypothetical protein
VRNRLVVCAALAPKHLHSSDGESGSTSTGVSFDGDDGSSTSTVVSFDGETTAAKLALPSVCITATGNVWSQPPPCYDAFFGGVVENRLGVFDGRCGESCSTNALKQSS